METSMLATVAINDLDNTLKHLAFAITAMRSDPDIDVAEIFKLRDAQHMLQDVRGALKYGRD